MEKTETRELLDATDDALYKKVGRSASREAPTGVTLEQWRALSDLERGQRVMGRIFDRLDATPELSFPVPHALDDGQAAFPELPQKVHEALCLAYTKIRENELSALWLGTTIVALLGALAQVPLVFDTTWAGVQSAILLYGRNRCTA